MSIIKLKIIPAQNPILSLEQALQIGFFNGGLSPFVEQGSELREAITAPVLSTQPRELILFYEGNEKRLPAYSNGLSSYLAERKLKVIEKPHPSLFPYSMAELPEQRLDALGLPRSVNIIMLTDESSFVRTRNNHLNCLRAIRGNGKRSLAFIVPFGTWRNGNAFLVEEL